MSFCKNCGKEIDSPFCPYCGTKVDEEVKQVEKPKAPRKSPYIRWDEIDKLFGIFQKKSTGENDDEYEYEEITDPEIIKKLQGEPLEE